MLQRTRCETVHGSRTGNTSSRMCFRVVMPVKAKLTTFVVLSSFCFFLAVGTIWLQVAPPRFIKPGGSKPHISCSQLQNIFIWVR